MKNSFLIRLILIAAVAFAAGIFVGYERGADQARTIVKERLEK